MFDRRQVSHENLWYAVVKSPLALFYFVGPFFAGVLLSQVFTHPVAPLEWVGAAIMMFLFSGLIYLNGLLGAFFFGIPLYYFLNAVRFQNKWVYLLAGFPSGGIFNLLYPWYSRFLYENVPVPPMGFDAELTRVAVASYPVIFGLFGMLVARRFWQELAEKPLRSETKAQKQKT